MRNHSRAENRRALTKRCRRWFRLYMNWVRQTEKDLGGELHACGADAILGFSK